MVSHALSSRRQNIRRPKVCKPPPPPPPPPPDDELPARWCQLDPRITDGDLDEDIEFEFEACCVSLPESDPVQVQWSMTGGSVEALNVIGNCAGPLQALFQAPEEGVYLVTVKFTWTDTGVCYSNCTITVTDPNGNGNGDD